MIIPSKQWSHIMTALKTGALCLLFSVSDQAFCQIVENPSFEGPAYSESKVPEPWVTACGTCDTQPGLEGYPEPPPSHGLSYLGCLKGEATSQKLSSPVLAGVTYTFSMDIAFVPNNLYPTVSPMLSLYFTNDETYVPGACSPVTGSGAVWTSPEFEIEEEWKTFTISFTTTEDYNYIVLLNTGDGGYVLVDKMTPFLTSPYVTTTVPVSCNGGSDGSAAVQVLDGEPPFAYQWNTLPAQYNDTATGLAAGTYKVYITDGNGDIDSVDVTVTEPPPLEMDSLLVGALTCNGSGDGQIDVTGKGGTAPLMYSLNTGGPQPDGIFNALDAGNHVIRIEDARGCFKDTVVAVMEPEALDFTVGGKTELLCNGDDNGRIEVVATGGTPQYAYSMGAAYLANPVFDSLSAGDYAIAVRDSHGCIHQRTVTVSQPDPVGAEFAVVDNPCNGDHRGEISVVATGGVAPYEYALDGSAYQSGPVFSMLLAGIYMVSVKDGNGCTADFPVQVQDPPLLVAEVGKTDSSSCSDSTGSVTLIVSGGTPPYSYSADGVDFAAGNLLSGLPVGDHMVYVRDENNCTTALTVTIPPYSSPSIVSVSEICNPDSLNYRIQVVLTSGNRDAYAATVVSPVGLTGGFSGNTWYSNEIPSGTAYEVAFLDQNNCQQAGLKGAKDCGCPVFAGVLQPLRPVACTDGRVAVSHDGNHVIPAGDTLEYVLHDGSAVMLGNTLARNNTGEFSLIPATMSPGVTYYITAVAGTHTGNGQVDLAGECLDQSNGIGVLWRSDPVFQAVFPSGVCPNSPAEIELYPSGTALLFDLDMDNGNNLSNVAGGDRMTLLVGNADTAVAFTGIGYADAPVCYRDIDEQVSVAVFELPQVKNEKKECDSNNEKYRVLFDIEGGDPNGYTVNGIPSGTSFVSGWIDSGMPYNLVVNDSRNCEPKTVVTGAYSCSCITAAGTATDTTPLDVCDGVSAVYPHGGDEVLDGNDALEYILYDGAAGAPASVLLRNQTGVFSFNPSLAYNTRYYISPVAGDSTGNGLVDFSDPCFHVGEAVAVVFRMSPGITPGALPNDSLCVGDPVNLLLGFTGTPPFGLEFTNGASEYVVKGLNAIDTVTHTGLAATTEYAFTRVTDRYCSRTISENIRVVFPAPLVVDTLYKPITCTGGADGRLIVQVQGGYGDYTYQWEDGNGIPLGNEPSIDGLKQDVYSVAITDRMGCAISETYNLPLPPPFEIDFVEVINQICFQDDHGRIVATAPGGERFGLWGSNPAGVETQIRPWQFDGNFIRLQFLPGSQYLKIVAQNDKGCEDDTTVHVSGLFPIAISGSPDMFICPETSARLVACAVGGKGEFSYSWNGGAYTEKPDGDSSVWEVTPGEATVYEVIATDKNGCPSPVHSITVSLPAPLSQVATPDDSICAGDQVLLSATPNGGTGAYSYRWENSEGQLLSAQREWIFDLPETERLIVSVTDSCGTTVKNEVVIGVTPFAEVDFQAIPDTEGCAPLEALLMNTTETDDYNQCAWFLNEVKISDACDPFLYSIETPGRYDLTLKVSNAVPCISSKTIPGYLSVLDNAQADYHYMPQAVNTLNTTVQLANNSRHATAYRWSLDDLYISHEKAPSITLPPQQEGRYRLCLEALNPKGCHDTLCRQIKVSDKPVLYMPNAFTPDGDGINDRLFPAVGTTRAIAAFEMRIFNRWGEEIFATQAPDTGWDGTFHGIQVPVGVYNWSLKIRLQGRVSEKVYYGSVRVIR